MVLVPAMGFMRFVPDLVPNGPSMMWMTSSFGPFLIGLLVVLWWLTASRARWFERILGVLGLVGAVGIEQMICHPSMRGPLPIVLTIPMAIAAFAIGTMLFGRMLSVRRTVLALGLGEVMTAPLIAALTATGGVLLIGVGLRLLGIRAVAVGDLLPALLIAPLLTAALAR